MASEDTTLTDEAGFDALEIDVYERNKANIRRLKEHLPDDLVANLAREVIRRVVSKGSAVEASVENLSRENLEQLALALIDVDDHAAPEFIRGLRSEGKSPETIYLVHLAAAARVLGEWWEEDRTSFAQVTLATGRIFAIMRSMRHLFEPTELIQGKAALFASVPGEDHTLGVRMAADLFRKDGWDISLKTGLDHDALVAEIEQTPARILGLSFSGDHSIEALSRLIIAVRICAPHVAIFISGQNVEKDMALLKLMDVEGFSSGIEDAKERLGKLWEGSARR